MNNQRIQQLRICHREMFGNVVITCVNPDVVLAEYCGRYARPVNFPFEDAIGRRQSTPPHKTALRRTQSFCDEFRTAPDPDRNKRRASALVDELLIEIYNSFHNGTTDYYSTSGKSHKSWTEVVDLHQKDVNELHVIAACLREYITRTGGALVRQLKRRDALRRQQQAHCDVISTVLGQRASEATDMRFTIRPTPGESGFSQWVAAMKMVAQLPGGIPPEFRRRLWITMAERHLASRGVDWSQVEKSCFSEWSHPADAELGIQIVKDLHRTGCSLFCGEDGQENQALLKKVLLAYARWNKAVGYCQGFNMLAALILQVTDKCESDALKLMIYLIEGVLPDSYFADSLRGLSVDMAVFRELLRSKLPRLSKHLDVLQNAAKDGSRSYEPPLTNVFTMQWFLTLFCNCLPQPTVLRVWDLIFLEGNEILLRTALAIWQVLAQRILAVRTADEFYCAMGALTGELLESNLIDANALISAIVAIGPLAELKNLRDHYLYNITPWGTAVPRAANKPISLHPKHSIPLDISALKKQYVKLKQRQRQAHVIFTSAISRQASPPPAPPVAMNHLLVGKRALGPCKRIGPPKGSIPPARQVHPTTLHWKDAEKQSSSSSSSDTELCDENGQSSSDEEDRPSNKSQLLTDNLNSGADKDGANATTIDSGNKPISDSLSPSPVNLKLASDSEDESAEFESFLADRVKCFKADVAPPDDISVSSCTRRHSELALQIIQENSLILHRIMQCQSRFSPSPPLFSNYSPETSQSEHSALDIIIEPSDVQKMENVHSWIDSQPERNDFETFPEKIYESPYRSILEKSKSLDERYNTLFSSSHKEKLSPILGRLHESKSETPVGSSFRSPDDTPSPNQSNIDFLESMIPKRDSDDTLVLPSMSDDDTKDSRSSKLIRENLDLLKTFSANKAKEQQQQQQQDTVNLSEKLIQENVDLLESIISSDKSFNKMALEAHEEFRVMESANTVGSPNNTLTYEEVSSKLIDLGSTTSKALPNVKLDDNECAMNCSDSGSRFDSEETTNKIIIDYSCDKSPDAIKTSPNNYDRAISLSINIRERGASPTFPELSPKSSDCDDCKSLKSPSHRVFNPFPVALNSRQNKEVPLKLGLYKK